MKRRIRNVGVAVVTFTAVFLSPFLAFGAITRDSGCSTGGSGGVSTVNCSFTMAHAGTIVTYCSGNFSGSGTTFSTTDSQRAMTAEPSTAGFAGGNSSLRQAYYFYDTNASAGSQTITTTAGASGFMDCSSQGYDGITLSSTPVAFDTGTQATSNTLITDTVTTDASDWSVYSVSQRCTAVGGNQTQAQGQLWDSDSASASTATIGCNTNGDIGLNVIGMLFSGSSGGGGGGGGGGATSTATFSCVLWTSSSTCAYYEAATSSPLYVQDDGDVLYVLGWIEFSTFLITCGFLWNIIRRS